jgi:hypothetical protein
MLARESPLFGCTRPKPSQGSVPVGLTLASDFGFCFQCKVGSSLVLRRPIETTSLIGKVKFYFNIEGNATTRPLGREHESLARCTTRYANVSADRSDNCPHLF